MKIQYCLLLLLTTALFGCARTSVTMIDSAERPQSENVQIISDRSSITSEFTEIAILNSEGGAGASPNVVLKSMIRNAKSIGADAIILEGQDTKDSSIYVDGQFQDSSVNIARGVAIVFPESSTNGENEQLTANEKTRVNSEIENLTRELENHGPSYDLFMDRGKYYLQVNDFEKAEVDFLNALDLTNEPEALYQLGRSKYFQGENSESIENINQAIEKGFDDELAFYYLGLAYADVGNHEKACENFNISGEMGYLEAYGKTTEYCN